MATQWEHEAAAILLREVAAGREGAAAATHALSQLSRKLLSPFFPSVALTRVHGAALQWEQQALRLLGKHLQNAAFWRKAAVLTAAPAPAALNAGLRPLLAGVACVGSAERTRTSMSHARR